ncbi:hypothetical protein NTE_00984 [Candidatus Nitrososphaera evergladensis SR1]|uniref:Uncharacterized protein n=1 Tax=Candidatus Nitrososphaera evergladensis SR1 TaxID=1459636 RepID=A0A075MUT0_9ARCH|nr:hypothetical protein NTE_00984 [Candidatus Nitrososphaera evergladensis SR1]
MFSINKEIMREMQKIAIHDNIEVELAKLKSECI